MEIEECHPLVCFDEIKNWNPPSEAAPKTRICLQKVEKKSRTIVCHDMRGGYLEDRLIRGSTNHKSYAFWHWSMVDVFVYFSHKLLTIPPPGWIKAAHLHGVLILGTFITEWEGGTIMCEEIFTNDEYIDLLADKMSLVAAHHDFDGYLINIENRMSEVALQGIIKFLKKLQTQLKMIKEENLLIWYDSVTINGELLWQNELNAKNYPFFEFSDGIFLNYTWKRENLEASVAAASIRSFDVYVGVDIFGRGTYGGGGWETWQAVNVIRQYPLSVALFAPGWVYENFEEDYHNMQDKFWNFLRPYLRTNKRKLEFPIETSFCRGFGLYRRKFGKIIDSSFFNLSLQNLQAPSDEINLTYHLGDSYHGGGSIKILGGAVARILDADICLEKRNLFCLAYKVVSLSGRFNNATIDEEEKSSFLDLGIFHGRELRFTFKKSSSETAVSRFVPIFPIASDENYMKHMHGNITELPSSSWQLKMFMLEDQEPIGIDTVTVDTDTDLLIGYFLARRLTD